MMQTKPPRHPVRDRLVLAVALIVLVAAFATVPTLRAQAGAVAEWLDDLAAALT